MQENSNSKLIFTLDFYIFDIIKGYKLDKNIY